jgi:hypothetical protein
MDNSFRLFALVPHSDSGALSPTFSALIAYLQFFEEIKQKNKKYARKSNENEQD